MLTAGFPCQDIRPPPAGARVSRKAQRSGLWTDIVAGLRVLRPALLVVENVAALRWRHGGLHRVLGDLAEAGYDAIWRSVRAADIGAAHRRERVFLLGWPQRSTGMLPTPTAHDGNSNGLSAATRQSGPSLLERLRHLRTPTASDPRSAAIQTTRTLSLLGCLTLTRSVRLLLATSAASDVKDCTRRTHHSGPSLPEEARRLPTPGASDAGRVSGTGRVAGRRQHRRCLPLWTPRCCCRLRERPTA